MRSLVAFAFALPVLIAACGGKTQDGAQGTAGGGTPPGKSDNGGPSTTASISASQVQAAQADCAATHGSAAALSSGQVARTSFVGSWLLCSTGSPATMFAPGIRFTPDGRYSRLVADGSGGLVGGTGLQAEGTWRLTCDGSPASDTQGCNAFAVTLTADANELGPMEYAYALPSFEDSPRRMFYPDYYDGNPGESSPIEELWLVPIR